MGSLAKLSEVKESALTSYPRPHLQAYTKGCGRQDFMAWKKETTHVANNSS